MKLTAKDAFDLAQQFHDLSTAVGDYRFKNWKGLTKTQRERLKDFQLDLLNYSSHLVTEAVGLVLDDSKGGLEALTQTTAEAEQALATVAKIKSAIEITAALVKLGAAIASENPAAIASAAEEVTNTVVASGAQTANPPGLQPHSS